MLEQASASAAGGVEPPGLDEVACRGSPLPSFRELSEHPSRGAETSQQKSEYLCLELLVTVETLYFVPADLDPNALKMFTI